MDPESLPVQLSRIDSERFGIVIARAPQVTTANLPHILDWSRKQHVKMLIARCSANALPTVHAMEQSGFLLMDTLLYFSRDLVRTLIPQDTLELNIKPAALADQAQVRQVAADAFRGYFGHYHSDPRLDRARCDELYASWAERAVESRQVADEVLVAASQGEILGLAALKINSPDEVDATLFAVAPFAQRRGVYRSLLVNCLHWAKTRGAARLISSTQLANVASQKSWTRVGFEFHHAFYTFHKWFD